MFDSALTGFRTLVAGIGPEQWAQPGLGEWNVRELVAHTSRAMSTVCDYLESPIDENAVLIDATSYWHRSLHSGNATVINARVADRGRETAATMGVDPLAFVDALVERARRLMRTMPMNRVVTTPVGNLELGSYLTTRSFELAVHGLDIARATGQAYPADLDDALQDAGRMCIELAHRDGKLSDVLMALLGRTELPGDFNLF